MDISPQDKDLLIRTVIGEAANEPDDGKAAVANVILNRYNSGKYGNSISDVVLAPKQFEPWATRRNELLSYSPDSPIYKKVSSIVDNQLNGGDDPTNGATNFADVNIVKQRGNVKALNWINKMSNVTKIGNHTFGNADGEPMAQNNINIEALANKYGNDGSSSSPLQTTNETATNAPVKITVTKEPDIDIDALATKYGQSSNNQQSITNQSQSNTSAPNDEWWQNQNDPSLLGIGKRIGIGLVRGAKDVLDTGAHGLANAVSYAADKILPEQLAAPIQQSAQDSIGQDIAARNEFNKEYANSPAADIGRIGGQIAATIPMMPTKIMGGVDAALNATPTIAATGAKIAAPLINRLGSAVVKGGIGGGIFGGATSSQNDKSLAENVGENAITGAIGGPIVEGAAGAAKKIGQKIVGNVSPTRAMLAKRAEQLGINLPAVSVSQSPFLKRYDMMSSFLPLSGGSQAEDKALTQFTRAVSHTFGADTDEITPQVISNARKQIGQQMENIAGRNTLKVDKPFIQDLLNIHDNVKHVGVDTEVNPVVNQLRNIISKVKNGEIDGETYKSLTNYKGVLSQAQKSSNPTIRNAANDIREALDNLLQRSIPDADKVALQNARRQYKSVMTIKKLAEADEEGQVSPLRLMQKVMNAPGGKLGSGELGELADIGRAFFKKPNSSGTAENSAILNFMHNVLHSPLSAAAGTAAALKSGATLLDTGLGASALVANRYARKGLNSSFVRNSIVNSSLGGNYGMTNKLAGKVIPFSAALKPPRDQLKITDQREKR